MREYCKNGHPWVSENLYNYKNRISCKLCHKDAAYASYTRVQKDPLNRKRHAAPPTLACKNGHVRTKENTIELFKNGKPNGIRCKECWQIWYDGIHERNVAYRLMKHHDMTTAERDALLASQDGACPGCGKKDCGWKQGSATAWHIDHNHDTNKTRGILCGRCNTPATGPRK